MRSVARTDAFLARRHSWSDAGPCWTSRGSGKRPVGRTGAGFSIREMTIRPGEFSTSSTGLLARVRVQKGIFSTETRRAHASDRINGHCIP
jgi:hypothetical protein